VLPARVGRLAMTAERVSDLIEKCESASVEGTLVVAKYALHRRTGVVGKERGLTS
jgi:hypothetical protein